MQSVLIKAYGACKQDQDHGVESSSSHAPPFSCAGAAIDQVEMFENLGTAMHATRGLKAALETLCKAGKSAMFGLHKSCTSMTPLSIANFLMPLSSLFCARAVRSGLSGL